MSCAVGSSEGLCWNGGVLLILASSELFLMLVSHESAWSADGSRVLRCGVHGFACVDYNHGNLGE